jgi:hypothetical protein
VTGYGAADQLKLITKGAKPQNTVFGNQRAM